MPYLIKNKIQFLSEASKILSSTLNYNVTLAIIAKLLVTSVSDFCMIDVFYGRKLKRLSVKVSDPSKQNLARKMYNFLPDPKNRQAIYETAKKGKPIIIKKVTKSWLKKVSKIDEERETIKKLGLNSHLFVPLKSRYAVIGVLTLASTDKKFFYTREDAIFIEELANRIGTAIDKAKLYSEAKEALRTRDEFLSIATHELKTPLTAILLNLQIALRKIRNTKTKNPEIESILKMVEVSESQSLRMSRLINDLLNVSVVSTGRLKIEKEKVELNELIKDTIERFETQSRNIGIKINFEEGKKIIGNWDKIRLEQVVANLLSNAIKYGKEKPVTISTSREKNKAYIKVKDHGIGIPKQNQKIIFDRFKRAVGGKKYRGLGVGLYISQQIMKAHKGKLKVKSEQEKGSEFIIELPLD